MKRKKGTESKKNFRIEEIFHSEKYSSTIVMQEFFRKGKFFGK